MPRKPPASEVNEQAGRRLHAIRVAVCKEMDLTQEQFAAQIGVSRPALGNWEAGRLPDPRAMVRLHAWLGIGLDCIYLGDLRGVPYGWAVRIQKEAERAGATFRGMNIGGERAGLKQTAQLGPLPAV